MIVSEDYLQKARTALMQAHAQLARDIRHYPTPIAGCDDQFNSLLSQKKNAAAAIRMLETNNFVPTPRNLVG